MGKRKQRLVADDADGVTLGEVARRVDRFEGEVGRRFDSLERTITDRLVPTDLYKVTQDDLARRVSDTEVWQDRADVRLRAGVLAVVVCLISSGGAILAAVLSAH
jgi:hypothetical protein